MIKNISFLFLFVALGMSSCSKKDEDAVSIEYPEMSFVAKEHDFGTVNQGDKVEHTFGFTNTGKKALVIEEAHGSCGCTVPEFSKESINPGEDGEIKVSFNSAGKTGEQSKSVFIFCNTKEGKEVLKIKSTIIPQGEN